MEHASWMTVARQIDRLYGEGTATGCGDDQLLSRFTAARDESGLAFAAIVRRHGPMVLEVCRRVLGNRHAAEDALQATFLILARRASSIAVHPGGSLGPWLHSVAFRTAREARRSAGRRQVRERRAAHKAGDVFEDVRSAGLGDDERRILHEEVARLPEKYRSAVVLCYFEGLTHDQAAETLRWPVGTVRGYLARARDLLRSRLIGRGIAPAVAIGLLDSHGASNVATLAAPLADSVLRAVAQGSVDSIVATLTGTIVRRQATFRAGRTLGVFLVFALGAGGVGWVGSHLVWPAEIGRAHV
jgi:RNA polymerase sigma factor (sigma-70 family)